MAYKILPYSQEQARKLETKYTTYLTLHGENHKNKQAEEE